MILKPLLVLGILSLITGCASFNKHAANLYPEPAPDKGLVYFYRERQLAGTFVSYNIKEDNAVVGAVANNTYFFIFTTPGKHTYTANLETGTSRTMEIEAGKTYYIACGATVGILTPRPTLSIVHEAEAKAVLPTLTYATK